MVEVSVIVPVYNVSQYIKRCIDSIAYQSFSDFEAIFVNDGATDDSAAKCKECIASYPKMRIISKENGGLSSARLFGLHEAVGRYVVFVDSDDYLQPDYLEKLYGSAIRYDADVSMCAYYTNRGGEKTVNKFAFLQGVKTMEKEEIADKYVLTQLPDVLRKGNFLPSFLWLRMFKRSLLTDDLFVSERLVYQEDLVLTTRIFKRINRIAVVDEPLYNYCVNQGSLTQCYRPNAWEMMMNLRDDLEKDLVSVHGEEKDYRMDGMLLCAVHFALINASRSRNYCLFKNAYMTIMHNLKVMKVLGRTSIRRLCLAHKFMICMIKLRLPYVLFGYYRNK